MLAALLINMADLVLLLLLLLLLLVLCSPAGVLMTKLAPSS
jgi:hypothetical protein